MANKNTASNKLIKELDKRYNKRFCSLQGLMGAPSTNNKKKITELDREVQRITEQFLEKNKSWNKEKPSLTWDKEKQILACCQVICFVCLLLGVALIIISYLI